MSQGADSLPRVNRADFYRLTELAFLTLLAEAVRAFAGSPRRTGLSARHTALAAWAAMCVDVPNGGFAQFFYNRGGDAGVEQAAALLESLGATRAAAIVREALVVYRRHRPAFRVANPWDGLFGSIREFDKPDRTFCTAMRRGERAVEAWARKHAAALFAGDDGGGPIDPKFTGSVEARLPAEGVVQHLEVRRGKANGVYRESFEDGTFRLGSVYRNGHASADLWPSGQVRKQEARRGPHRVIEWYYPGGAVHKRFVAGKDFDAVEPVRLYYESGQLAEEQHFHGHRADGPWLKFFEDGSPRLVAEETREHGLVVRDAWDVERRQVVRDGVGVFHDDGHRISPFYALFLDSGWARAIELRDGRPHGRVTTWHRGLLWSIEHFDHGQLHGDTRLYWDNGRLQSVTEHLHGEAKGSRRYPKFDEPRPAVLIAVEADEALYAAWKCPLLDEYPRPLNLPEVQARIAVPDMLSGVYERNLAGAIKSNYEDLNTFADDIFYRVRIDALGSVESVRATGSGIYSGALWGTYPPLIRELRFWPGRLRGRAIAASALVRVNHTFVEAAAHARPPPGS